MSERRGLTLVSPPEPPAPEPGTVGHLQDTVAFLVADYLDFGAAYVPDGTPAPTREEAARVLAHFGAYARRRLCVTLH